MSDRGFEQAYFDLARASFDRNKKKDKLKYRLRSAEAKIDVLLADRTEMIECIRRLESIAKYYGPPDQYKPSKWTEI